MPRIPVWEASYNSYSTFIGSLWDIFRVNWRTHKLDIEHMTANCLPFICWSYTSRKYSKVERLPSTPNISLIFTLSKLSSDKETPRRTRQLFYISEFTNNIRYIVVNDNVVADSLSRVETITCPSSLDFAGIATTQCDDTYSSIAASSNVIFKKDSNLI